MAQGQLFGKIILSGVLHCVTGLHIGGNQDAAEIGGVDLLVLRDPLTREPYIPGSSLKGKLRSLLERLYYAKDPQTYGFGKVMTISGQKISHHECSRQECAVCRLFGASRDQGAGVKENRPALLYVRDAWLTKESKDTLEEMESGYYLTEVKFENTLDRITSAANPRQVERVPRGTEFNFALVYNLSAGPEEKNVAEDLRNLLASLLLLTDDYLGGNGSRGYGQVKVRHLGATWRSRGYYLDEAREEVLDPQGEGEDIRIFGARALEWVAGLGQGGD